ncbi:protein translocase subunit SecA 2-like [Xyrichtys novacula]|uniref:Protein translocase subunit SecA 2-like n=1 Tax=Xyrichtys novacula TaxID=13765 RepID=A0AAV1HJ25_XYRNO|nr:protein translocase subunit SecA 2-like [Xyrichtys novacula]
MEESDSEMELFLPSMLRTLLSAHSGLDPKDDENLLLNTLQRLVTSIKWEPTEAAELFGALMKRFELTEKDGSDLIPWMLEMLHCIEINYITPTWKCQMKRTLIECVQDKNLTNEGLKKLLADDRDKTLDEILEEIRQQELNDIDKELLRHVKDIVSSVNRALDTQKDASQMSGLKKDLLELCQAVEKVKFRPRLTQMVSWCIMVLSDTGRLIQVATGEGKSCIVAMFAAHQVRKGRKVDIMSSSPVLAERDLMDWKKFYKKLGLTVSCNCNKQDEDSKECYESQVVYGTVEEFAGDWLQHHFLRKDTFGKRKHECAIVDEVDSLMLDKGLHVVYISSDMPALHHLSPLLAFIWSTVNQYSKIGGEITVGRKCPFHQVVLESIKSENVSEFTILQMAEDTGLLTRGSVKVLRKSMSLLPEKMANITINQMAKFLNEVERKYPPCQFALYCMTDDGAIEKVNKGPQTETGDQQRVPLVLIDGGFCQYIYSNQERTQAAAEAEIKQALRYTSCDLSQDKSTCYIPGFLSDLVESKLKVWIENAFLAKTMSRDREYVLERHGVVPVDYSCTGVIENDMKWTDGLQQFLEMKHGGKLSDMTAITNYMSSVGMLQKYGNQIFGISGTLGQKAETETLQKIYEGIKTCQIPTFKRRKLFEVEGVIVCNDEEWRKKICEVVSTQTSSTTFRGQRAVLVICETIGHAKDLYHALGDQIPAKKLYISNNMDNAAVFAQLGAGEVIIATNLAGRGTDLQVSKPVKAAGGLFVVQTFLPKNARVEAQAFGRTARQGAPGSAQLIVCSGHLPERLQLLVYMRELLALLESIVEVTSVLQSCFMMRLRSYQRRHGAQQAQVMSSMLSQILSESSSSVLKKVKKIRDDSVNSGLDSFLKEDIPQIKKKEELFCQYLRFVDEIHQDSDNKPEESYFSALNESWGMWLLMDFNASDCITELKKKLDKDLKAAKEKVSQRESPLSNLHHYTVTGNELREKGHLAESIKMYTKAIQMDHCWAAVAYYNRAFASLTQQNGHQDPDCIRQALEDLQLALKSAELYCEQNEVTERYSKPEIGDLRGDFCTRIECHMLARKKVWDYFKANITEAIKKVDRADDFGGTVRVEESLVYFLAPVEDLLLLSIFLTVSQIQIPSRDPLRIHQLTSEPSFDIIHELSCLKSLGLTQVYTVDTMFSVGGLLSKVKRKLF